LLGIAPVLVFAGGAGGGLRDILIVSGLICFTLAWVALGVLAIRMDRPATVPRPA
jgi:hypothetical protein